MVGKDELIVSVSGIRGIVGKSLSPDIVFAYASALGTYVRGQPVVLGRDGRPSGKELHRWAVAGLTEAGCSVRDLDIAATPTVGVAITQCQASGGLQITASHNPAEWNGMKLFGARGNVLTAAEGQQVNELFARRAFRKVAAQEQGSVTQCPEADDWHCERILPLVDAEAIRRLRARVVLDANGGAGGRLGRRLLEALNCRGVWHACDANGIFGHEPEPLAANLRNICPLITQHGADIGLALDPDADRLALIDETARYIGEELTLALAVLCRVRQDRGPVVANMSTSRVIEDIAKRYGCPFFRAPVGEANVLEKMREVGAVIGGEGNGGVIDPRVIGVRDPFIGIGLILHLMAETGKSVSALVAELPAYHIVKDKLQLSTERLPEVFMSLRKAWADAVTNQEDGLRLDWEDRWVHIRPSNTEPIVRIIAEAPREDEAKRLVAQVRDHLRV
jgi:phosphomannomutase